jgi:hypothetical protein
LCDYPYPTLINRHPELKAHIVMGQSFFKQGLCPPPAFYSGLFFLVISRKSRAEMLTAAQEIRKQFNIDLSSEEL